MAGSSEPKVGWLVAVSHLALLHSSLFGAIVNTELTAQSCLTSAPLHEQNERV